VIWTPGPRRDNVEAMPEPDVEHPDSGPLVAQGHEHRPVELLGPSAEVEQIVRRASPARLALHVGAVVVVLAGGAVGAWAGRAWWAERRARTTRMAHVPGARVRIGNDRGPPEEAPEHEVTLGAFDIDVTEVTVGAYAACVRQRRCTPPQKGELCNWGREDVDEHPINCVDHDQAAAYCDWVQKRLPTEKEWEYAARGDDGRRFPWGAERPSPSRANLCGAECRLFGARLGRVWPAMYESEDGFPLTAPVGRFPAGRSPFGLEDTGGNVREWTSSPFCAYPETSCGNEQEYVIRGAGFLTHFEMNVEATTREAIGKNEALEVLGFRCARSAASGAQRAE
jgi:formylglycine-generating enzyme required for sulfatase activity